MPMLALGRNASPSSVNGALISAMMRRASCMAWNGRSVPLARMANSVLLSCASTPFSSMQPRSFFASANSNASRIAGLITPEASCSVSMPITSRLKRSGRRLEAICCSSNAFSNAGFGSSVTGWRVLRRLMSACALASVC